MLFGKYGFNCTFITDAILPPYKGSTFRGAFGGALKTAVCTVKNAECPACLLSKRCLYARVFEPVMQRDSSPPNHAIPHPYIIEPDLNTQTKFAAKEKFAFSLLLFGEFTESLPYFIYAVDMMGKSGIGKMADGQRAQFSLDSVTGSDGTIIYDSGTKRVTMAPKAELMQPPALLDETNGSLKIKLTTPLRFKNDNRLSKIITFGDFIRVALRRVSGMHAAYGAGDPPLDYRWAVAAAIDVVTVESCLSWHDWKRYSNRQEESMLFGGMLGNISFVGKIGPFMQIIEQASVMHIGKQATFGLGQFVFTWEPDPPEAPDILQVKSRKKKNTLSAEDRETIRTRCAVSRQKSGDYPLHDLMREYSISRATIYRILQESVGNRE